MSQIQAIVEQFTKLAGAYSIAPHIQDGQALDWLLEATRATRVDTSLDVACGTGTLACHFAGSVLQATGVDVTPAMLDQARELQQKLGLKNIAWQIADVNLLPFADSSFSIVTCRYALHHFERPTEVLHEMVRVCASGGRVAIADLAVSEDTDRAANFNELERIHDPTHLRALSLSEHLDLFARAGLPPPEVQRYAVEFTLTRLRKALAAAPDRAAAAEKLVRRSLVDDALGINSREIEGEIRFAYPIVILCSSKP